jgi:hypothetical protein
MAQAILMSFHVNALLLNQARDLNGVAILPSPQPSEHVFINLDASVTKRHSPST